MLTQASILREAKSLIQDPGCWTKYWMGVNRLGEGVPAKSAYAVKFCALGALDRVNGYHMSDANSPFWRLNAAAEEMGYSDPAELNNKTDHETTLKMYDRAIELAELAARTPG
jgi:hypothetical protein